MKRKLRKAAKQQQQKKQQILYHDEKDAFLRAHGARVMMHIFKKLSVKEMSVTQEMIETALNTGVPPTEALPLLLEIITIETFWSKDEGDEPYDLVYSDACEPWLYKLDELFANNNFTPHNTQRVCIAIIQGLMQSMEALEELELALDSKPEEDAVLS